MCRLIHLLYSIACFHVICGQEGAQYLQNAISDLRHLKGQMPARRATLKRVDTGTVQAIIPESDPTHKVSERRINGPAPPLSLTKGELAAIYEAAVLKGDTVKLNSGDNTYVDAVVHELDESQPNYDHKTTAATPDTAASGYYYYYYPVKSFLDELSSQSSSHEHQQYSHHPEHHEVIHTEKPQYQYHSHTHQHNVKITKDMVHHDKKKGLEPLFMAISGFIGMAVMYLISMLILPKLGLKKRGGGGGLKAAVKHKNERINEIARVAMQAIEGKDCEERFACELEKTARAFNVQDNRFVKLLKRMAPGSFGKQMNKVGKYTNKRLRCTAIPCKKKNHQNQPKKKPNANNAQKKT